VGKTRRYRRVKACLKIGKRKADGKKKRFCGRRSTKEREGAKSHTGKKKAGEKIERRGDPSITRRKPDRGMIIALHGKRDREGKKGAGGKKSLLPGHYDIRRPGKAGGAKPQSGGETTPVNFDDQKPRKKKKREKRARGFRPQEEVAGKVHGLGGAVEKKRLRYGMGECGGEIHSR